VLFPKNSIPASTASSIYYAFLRKKCKGSSERTSLSLVRADKGRGAKFKASAIKEGANPTDRLTRVPQL